MKIRDMKRSSWESFLNKDQIIEDYIFNDRKGKISLIRIKDVSKPFVMLHEGKEIVLADKYYYWLQLAFHNDYRWYTVMFDDNDNLVQIYIDITNGNNTELDNPIFEDMYLDYVVAEDIIYEQDRDELDEAYTNNLITKEEYERALHEGDKLHLELSEHLEGFKEIFIREQQRLKKKMMW